MLASSGSTVAARRVLGKGAARTLLASAPRATATATAGPSTVCPRGRALSTVPFASTSTSTSTSHLRTASSSHRPLSRPISSSAARRLATPVDEVPDDVDAFDLAKVERVSDQVDVCIVGGGPAGLSAAIRIMQLAKEQGKDEFRVVVLEKGGEVGQ